MAGLQLDIGLENQRTERRNMERVFQAAQKQADSCVKDAPFLPAHKVGYLFNASIDTFGINGPPPPIKELLETICAVYRAEGRKEGTVAVCAWCTQRIGMRRCANCTTRYCGKTCQRLHWKVHKKECGCAAMADTGVTPPPP